MKRYTQQVELTFSSKQAPISIIPDTGASVAVEFYSGRDWVEDDLSPITSPSAIEVSGLKVRLTPTGSGFSVSGISSGVTREG